MTHVKVALGVAQTVMSPVIFRDLSGVLLLQGSVMMD